MDPVSSPTSSKLSSLFGSRSVSLTHLPAAAYDPEKDVESADRDNGIGFDLDFDNPNPHHILGVRKSEEILEQGREREQEQGHDHDHEPITIPIYPSVVRQWSTLLVLNLAVMIDVISGSALFVVVTHTAGDLGLSGPDATWILNAYIITFAAFQVSAGRLADLSSAGWVFVIGIGTVATLNLVLSFLSDPIAFLILRAIQGMGAAMTIPSSYNITVRTFPEGKQRNRAIAILGLVGSVSFSLGVVIGGLFETVSWQWLFRTLSIVSFVATGAALLVVPRSRTVSGLSIREILWRMDPVGLLLSVGAIILLVLALTSGPEYGWNDPRFAASLPVSILGFIGFFVWEAKGRNDTNAMLPSSIWKTPGTKALVFLCLTPFTFWTTTAFGFPNYWQQTLGRTALDSAIRLLPVGIAALITSVFIQLKPKLLVAKRWLIFATLSLVPVALILYVFGGGGDGKRYWAYYVPAFVIGSSMCQYAFLAINVTVITSVPPVKGGVAGALMSVVMQLGNAVGLAIQAACLPDRGGHAVGRPWQDFQTGYWAIFGWIVASIVICGGSLLYTARRRGLPEVVVREGVAVL